MNLASATASESGAVDSNDDARARLAELRRDVLGWGAPRRRDLPWRRTRDPWAILVSEVMLQQTQVARILERWPRFLARFPTPAACAAAPLADVLAEWQGLGYPRRARYLHLAAGSITELGTFPDDLVGLMALPGVGPYTARAVLAFAYETDAAVVDTNIARTLSRVVGQPLTARAAQTLADEWLPKGEAWAWNQTLMDVGAIHCRPVPNCDGCPLRSYCAWRGSNDVPDPAPASANVSKPQARFAGSDREARGRLMAALSEGPVLRQRVAEVMERSPSTAARLVDALIAERLCSATGDLLVLGDGTDSTR